MTRYIALLNAVLGTVLLFAPITWMQIGPNGFAYYGPDVPDIRVYGAALTGKDLSFAPLMIMMLFQCFWITVGIFLSALCFVKWNKPSVVIGTSWFIVALLLLFPMWTSSYNDVIICNSDGAASDLTVHGCWGWYVYGSIVIIQVVIVVSAMIDQRRIRKSAYLNLTSSETD